MQVVFLVAVNVAEWAIKGGEVRKKFFTSLVEDNYWIFLVWYQFVDESYIFPTGFEWLVYFLHFWVQCNI